jgi:hypothetical protein
MSLWEQINEDLKKAMKEKDKYKLEALRAIKSQLLLLKTAEGGSGEITDEAALKVLQKMVKQRKESAQLYKENGREDLAEEELMQAKYIEQYLPKQMSEQELQEYLKALIDKLGAKSMRDMGKVMSVAMKELAGKADGKVISSIVKRLLSN